METRMNIVSHLSALYDRRLLSAHDLADLFRISRKSVYRMASRGELRPVRVGGQLRFEFAEIERFLDEGRDGESVADRATGGGTPPAWEVVP
jgi:excisionase family DNA binding protein